MYCYAYLFIWFYYIHLQEMFYTNSISDSHVILNHFCLLNLSLSLSSPLFLSLFLFFLSFVSFLSSMLLLLGFYCNLRA